MTMRPVPGAPPGKGIHYRARYATRPDKVVFTARCVCGSGGDATWIQFMDYPATCECACAAVREGAA